MASDMKHIAEINPSGQPARFAVRIDEVVYTISIAQPGAGRDGEDHAGRQLFVIPL